MKIGSYILQNNLLLAPMAGVTDKPFRQLCREKGAGMVVSEMVTSDPALFRHRQTRLRLDLEGEPSPRVVQIVGSDARVLATAARFNVDHGAEIIDINMGCPAKKVCKVNAGSALMGDEKLVEDILDSVVRAVAVPVTLKIRTGLDPERKNAVSIARLAEQTGVQAITVHGRTRQCRFNGAAEHLTARRIKEQVSIPVIANGDICSPEEAARVLACTGADGLMIGRAARGNPWIFSHIAHFLATGNRLPGPSDGEVYRTLMHHLESLYEFYGDYAGVRIARKHIGWYCRYRTGAKPFLALVNQAQTSAQQLQIIKNYFAACTAQDKVA